MGKERGKGEECRNENRERERDRQTVRGEDLVGQKAEMERRSGR